MSADVIIFVMSAAVAVFGAAMMITVRNPVAAVLYLILSLVAQAVLYVQLGALFLGAILVIVYAGAIMVLFLFVIMLLNLRGNEDLGKQPKPISLFTKVVIAVLLVMELVFMLKSVPILGATTGILAMPADNFGSVASVARLLFKEYMFPFQLTGILLTVAVVGAVVIAKRETPEELKASGAGEEVSG